MEFDVVTNERIRPAWAVRAVDELLHKIKDKPIWEGVDLLVRKWFELHPEDAKSLTRLKDERLLTNKNDYGATSDLSMRGLATVPTGLSDLITFFYDDDVRFDPKKFWREFVRKYPIFTMASRI